MAKRYIFDKRDMKKMFIKYGILFFIAFIIILPLNVFVLSKHLSYGMGIFICVFIALAIVLLGDLLIYLYKKYKLEKSGNKNKDE